MQLKGPTRREMVRRDTPRKMPNYIGVTLGQQGPRLRFMQKPPMNVRMATFKDAFELIRREPEGK